MKPERSVRTGGRPDHASSAGVYRLMRLPPPAPATALEAGPPRLSRREAEVLRLTAQAASPKQIAANLYLSQNTVKTVLRRITDKLGTSSRAETLIRAAELGLISAAPPPRRENRLVSDVLRLAVDRGLVPPDALARYGPPEAD